MSVVLNNLYLSFLNFISKLSSEYHQRFIDIILNYQLFTLFTWTNTLVRVEKVNNSYFDVDFDKHLMIIQVENSQTPPPLLFFFWLHVKQETYILIRWFNIMQCCCSVRVEDLIFSLQRWAWIIEKRNN